MVLFCIGQNEKCCEFRGQAVGKVCRVWRGISYLQGLDCECTFYGLPNIHKPDTPLRPTVSSTDTVSYNTAKELAKIIKPLVGLSTHHLQNTKDFIQQLKDVKLQQDEIIISYDIKALFTSVPIQPVLNIIKNKLENDQDVKQRTSMSVCHITSLLEYCLRSTYLVFQGKYYEQLEGAAMGSPLSPIIANIYMEEFETKALSTAPTPHSVEKVCWWHLCCHPNIPQRRILQPHKFNRREHSVYCSRHASWWILTLLRCSSHSSSLWNFVNICI